MEDVDYEIGSALEYRKKGGLENFKRVTWYAMASY